MYLHDRQRIDGELALRCGTARLRIRGIRRRAGDRQHDSKRKKPTHAPECA
jgi:hypothetical protein